MRTGFDIERKLGPDSNANMTHLMQIIHKKRIRLLSADKPVLSYPGTHAEEEEGLDASQHDEK